MWTDSARYLKVEITLRIGFLHHPLGTECTVQYTVHCASIFMSVTWFTYQMFRLDTVSSIIFVDINF